jgi:hypothetical protein
LFDLKTWTLATLYQLDNLATLYQLDNLVTLYQRYNLATLCQLFNLTTVMDQFTSHPFHLATWNVGCPQDAKWCEFVRGDTKYLNDSLEALLADPNSAASTAPALSVFRRARQQLLVNLHKFYPGSFNDDGTCDIHNFWVNSITTKSVAQAFARFTENDAHHVYSWGDREFPDRPTPISANDRLDPAMFKSTSSHKLPHFRRFEDAWLEYIFRKTPRGNLVKSMPPNQYMVNDPTVMFSASDIQVMSYLDLFYFDWCLTFFVWCLESSAAYSSFWSMREVAIRGSSPTVHRVHTANFIGGLGRRCTVVALQEMSAEQIETVVVPPLAKLVLPDKPSAQMACLLVKNALNLTGWNLFKDCWPATNPLSSRVAGCVTHVRDPSLPKSIHGDWMVVSVHCKPEDLDSIMNAMHTIRGRAFPLVTTMVLMGDLNWERAHLQKLGQVCRKNGFATTWSPFEHIPDTVNNVRSKYLQAQQLKGGKIKCAPKDHVLVWNRDNLIPRTTTGVITNGDFALCEPDEPLFLDLPSEHAAIVVGVLPPN